MGLQLRRLVRGQLGCRTAIVGRQFAALVQIIRDLPAHPLIGQKQHPRNFAIAQAIAAQQHRLDPILNAAIPFALVAN